VGPREGEENGERERRKGERIERGGKRGDEKEGHWAGEVGDGRQMGNGEETKGDGSGNSSNCNQVSGS